MMDASKIKTVFQPIMDIKANGTIGFEILNRPETTSFFPSTETFYDHIGKSGNVFKMERFLRNLSLERYAEQLKADHDLKNQLIFLNIQPQVLTDSAYRGGTTLELLEKYHLSPEQIVLELTEKEDVSDYRKFRNIIESYRGQGFRIAVDDAGTGYNSLKTIVMLKPEFIKIDKSLIRNIHERPLQQNMVELFLEFAAQSNTTVIAEGIETFMELAFLQNMGVELGQGYALGRPAPFLGKGKLPEVEASGLQMSFLKPADRNGKLIEI